MTFQFNDPEVNITVFMDLLSLKGENEAASESGHVGHAGFLLPPGLSQASLQSIDHVTNCNVYC